ncbi:MAG: Gfo/Idh/MocA family oxidoreductase [Planctomycetaceae bacterium]|nr:Gfo/Idh/MocA family oxidoreductase [Planctomycetaceae bacterium]
MTAMFPQITAAVVGTGFIGPVHVEALRRCGVTVRGILGSSPEKSTQAASALGLSVGYESIEQLLSDVEVDVVHITSPNRHHFEQTKLALAAGKHVLCEKPLAMTSDESRTLVQLAEQSGLITGVNYNIRYYPLCMEAAARCRSSDVGRVFHVNGSYVQDWLLLQSDYNWRVEAEDGGALRAIADIGTHWLDLIQFILGDHVVAVCADLQTVHPTRDKPVGGAETFSHSSGTVATEPVSVTTEDAGSVLLKFASGTRGVLSVSQVTAGRKNCLRFELAGEHQSLAWNSERPNELWSGQRRSSNTTLLKDGSLMSDDAAARADYPGGHNEGFPDTFKQLFRDFYAVVDAADPSRPATFPTFRDGHREVVLCEAILASHQQQRWVDVTSS